MHASTAETLIIDNPLDLKSVGQIKRGYGPVWLGWEVFEVGSINVENAAGGYSRYMLKALNRPIDILPGKSLEALFKANQLPEAGVLLGIGWYDLEHYDDFHFRWMGKESEVVLTRLPEGKCIISLDVEPIIDAGSKPFNLIVSLGPEQKKFSLAGRQRVDFGFNSSGEPLQILKLYGEGGMEKSPNNDPRLLKMRAFNIDSPHCTVSGE